MGERGAPESTPPVALAPRAVPLLELEHARIDLAGVPLAPDLTLTVAGPRVALRGDASPLFLALRREAVVARGAAALAGVALGEATASGVVGLAPRAAELPARWTAAEVVEASGHLAGWSRREARACARESLALLGVEQLGGRRCVTLNLLERRAVAVACAALRLPGGGPAALAFEEPFAGLDPPSAEWLAGVLERLSSGHALVWGAARADWQPAVASLAGRGELVDLVDGAVLAPPARADAPAPGYVLVAPDASGRLREALVRRGATVAEAPSALAVVDGLARLVVTLGEGRDERDLAEASVEAEAPLYELRPLEGAPGALQVAPAAASFR
ncbi:MAG: hypothetical protein IT376_11470 [Polyangiaceae bacterium]|nr:hypothetical protein [Polyangiaceae bacterium]